MKPERRKRERDNERQKERERERERERDEHVTQRYKLIRLERGWPVVWFEPTRLRSWIEKSWERDPRQQRARERANENKKDVRLPRRRKLRIKLGSRQLMSPHGERPRATREKERKRHVVGSFSVCRARWTVRACVCVCVCVCVCMHVRSLVRLLATSLKKLRLADEPVPGQRFFLSRRTSIFSIRSIAFDRCKQRLTGGWRFWKVIEIEK